MKHRPLVNTKRHSERLQFTPQILHGESTLTPRPNADRSGWELQAQQPTENYAALSFEVTLAPNEFLVIGAGSDRPETLGYQCFVRPDESAPVQRLLVIRTGRMAQNESVTNSEDASPFPSAAPPLAIQAALTSGRPSSR